MHAKVRIHQLQKRRYHQVGEGPTIAGKLVTGGIVVGAAWLTWHFIDTGIEKAKARKASEKLATDPAYQMASALHTAFGDVYLNAFQTTNVAVVMATAQQIHNANNYKAVVDAYAKLYPSSTFGDDLTKALTADQMNQWNSIITGASSYTTGAAGNADNKSNTSLETAGDAAMLMDPITAPYVVAKKVFNYFEGDDNSGGNAGSGGASPQKVPEAQELTPDTFLPAQYTPGQGPLNGPEEDEVWVDEEYYPDGTYGNDDAEEQDTYGMEEEEYE